ncbi:type II toxin-antitoxin system Phd/YefM family antitoxin [Lentilactobacillus parafarraginis]|mgnify:CR=1 FL=1|jgi:prevent-host-death family protein|uniref:Antitoxin n=2 Tax=Lentilactobacillus parafarraginis TaxID=390842 RepID=A0A0R1YTW0_9LACO|nr:type II toxin-antitoxin system prevent-host-death family antitoxin [Lentilactobacillus parafarraginis]KRM45757.1 hypothetical protein FD47_GL000944 [Lentilactobacillus parafarraginis DSM 18390 = JCM 14109]TLQ20734.1 type II toxin-antitoxin system Phd/YefM family antitoxin [Lentilactobacillus parafarraginis]
MKEYTPSDAQQHLSELIKYVNEQRKPVMITDPDGKDENSVVLMSKSDWDFLNQTRDD